MFSGLVFWGVFWNIYFFKFKITKQRNILSMFISVKFEKNTLNDIWGKHIVLNSNVQK